MTTLINNTVASPAEDTWYGLALGQPMLIRGNHAMAFGILTDEYGVMAEANSFVLGECDFDRITWTGVPELGTLREARAWCSGKIDQIAKSKEYEIGNNAARRDELLRDVVHSDGVEPSRNDHVLPVDRQVQWDVDSRAWIWNGSNGQIRGLSPEGFEAMAWGKHDVVAKIKAQRSGRLERLGLKTD